MIKQGMTLTRVSQKEWPLPAQSKTKLNSSSGKDFKRQKPHFDREGKAITKYWSNLNKENKPRDPIYSLKIPHSTPLEYTNNPEKMADIGRQHHHDLLSDG